MSEENKLTEELDRLALKQQRKERKLLKKIVKREERQKENDKKQLELKLGPKDQHITIISRNVAESIKPKEICNNNSDLNLTDNFPALNVTKSKHKQEKIKPPLNIEPQNSTTDKPILPTKKTHTLTINLTEILTKPNAIITQKPVPKEQIQKYCGNSLDSSQPERWKGKQREKPKHKRPTKLKSRIIGDTKKCDDIINFCDNVITDELNDEVKKFLCSIVRFQENLYKRDPIKGTARRRYITGFREVKKYLLVKKIKCLIIAPNIKNVIEKGTLYTIVRELISLAVINEIPYLFALSRRRLGSITLKKIPISCVGVFYYDGAEQSFNNILKLLETLRAPNENEEQDKQETVLSTSN